MSNTTTDVRRYAELKEKGSITLQRLGPGTFQLIIKNFDPSTGKELSPTLETISRSGLKESREQYVKQREVLNAGIAGFDSVIADIDAAARAAGDEVPEDAHG